MRSRQLGTGNRHHPGAIRDLAASVDRDRDFKSVAVPFATALAAELHMTAFISVYDNGDVVCLDRIHDMKGIEVHWWAVGGTRRYCRRANDAVV